MSWEREKMCRLQKREEEEEENESARNENGIFCVLRTYQAFLMYNWFFFFSIAFRNSIKRIIAIEVKKSEKNGKESKLQNMQPH